MYIEVAISLFLAWFIWYILTTYKRRSQMPPGPFPLPLIGNLHQLGFDLISSFEKLCEKYGAVFTISFPNGDTVVVNSAELAQEALVTRKDDMAGRLPETASYPLDIILEGRDILTADYGKTLVFRRKVFKHALRAFGGGVEETEERTAYAVKNLVKIIEEMDGRPFSPKKYAASAIIIALWKWISSKTCSFDDPTVKSLLDFNKKIMLLTIQGSIHNWVPLLKYLPTTFKKNLESVLKLREEIFETELQTHRETYDPDIIRDLTDSFLSTYENESAKETDKNVTGSIEDVKFLMIDVISGGSDSSSSFVVWYILYLLLNEDVQEKIHAELDKVVGRDRSPRWKDADNLHYMQATMCEVIRHSSFLPFAVHSAIRDTSIRSYNIPKGTTIFINMFNIHRDPKEWDEPKSFRPERFLDADGKFVGWATSPAFLPFNIGRRACPGKLLGKIQTFAFVSNLSHHFTFESPPGDPKPNLEFEMSATLCPKDFNVVAKKRI